MQRRDVAAAEARIMALAKPECQPTKKRVASIAGIFFRVWSEQEMVDVVCHRITMGMNKLQVHTAVGYPPRVNKTFFAGGVREQEVYDNGMYIYFESDPKTGEPKMVSYQTSQ
jgi:hypothetical protein